MEVIRGLYNLKAHHRGCVASIGNFDGVHLGHQGIISHLREQSMRLQLPAIIIIFEPQPQEYFSPQQASARLTRLREKLLAFREYNIDRVLCLPFNALLAAMPAEQFIENILIAGLDIKYLTVGDDFRFGQHRRGDFAVLEKASQQYGFELTNITTFAYANQRISSSRIRELLQAGFLSEAEQLLGRPYRLCGRVAHGDKRGRTIGIPTANIYLHRKQSPIAGVYAVTIHGLDNKIYQGVANVGNRPTVDGTRSLLEVYIFNFSQNIYGHHLQIEFVKKLRDEKRFESFDLLKQQIYHDVADAISIFQNNFPNNIFSREL